MSTRRVLALAIGAVLLAAGCGKKRAEPAEEAAAPDSMPRVVLETSMGRIVLELDRNRAPRAVDNIARHVNAGFYDGLIFHRVVPGFVIQTGEMTPDFMVRTTNAAPVPIEADNGLLNVRHSVGLARGADPNSGGVQFYINLRNSPELNFRARRLGSWGYTVFGRTIEGTDVVDRIGRVRTGTVRGVPEMPLEPILVTRAYIRRPGATQADSARP